MRTVSVDLGGTNVKAALVSDGEVVRFETVPVGHSEKLASLLPAIEPVVKRLLSASGAERLGIAFPGLVDSERSAVISREGKYTDAWETDLEGWARERFGLPLTIENDARAAAAGERAYGAAEGVGDFVLMILGTGIGAAAYLDGRPVRGKHFQAGITLGHTPSGGDRFCACCGGYGCAESEASTWALKDLIARTPGDGALKTERDPDFKLLRRYYESGDAVASAVFERCVSVWTDVLTTLVYAYDPELIVLSGGVMKWGDELADRLRDGLYGKAWTEWGKPRFAVAENPDASVLLGLHALAQSAT